MTDVQWYHIVIPLIGGGAMGAAIINAVVSAIRNRVQPVGRRIEIIPIFKETLGASGLRTKITISDGQNDYMFDNLFIAKIQLINRGNQDIAEFRFGITLSSGDSVIYVEPHSQDRHHIVRQVSEVSLRNPASEIDFILQPFNRGDSYSLDLFMVISKNRDKPGTIQFSSPHPIKFVDMPTIGEIMLETLRGFEILSIGPFGIFLRRRRR